MGRVDAHPVPEEDRHMSRLTRSCALLAACAAVAVPATAAHAADGPVATAAKKCSLSLSEQRNMGTTYVFSLSVSGGATCYGAKSLAKAFHACRQKNGAAGRCVRKVNGYACGESRYNQLSGVSYDATATCTKGSKKVVQKYQ